MPGRQVSRAARKEVDIVLIAIRFESERGSISMAQACERRGAVWGDVQLLQRESIIAKIKEGKKVVTGRQTDLEGDFEIFEAVKVSQNGGEETLFTGSVPSNADDLEIPLF